MARRIPDINDLIARAGFPRFAAKRIQAYWAYQRVRAYDAAAKGRLGKDRWRQSRKSAVAETSGALATLRAGSRDLVRNNGYAMSAMRQTTAHIIGKGLTPRWKGLSEGDKARALALWEEWADQADLEGDLDFYSLQKSGVETWWQSGESLLKIIPQPSSAKMKIPFKTQVLEPDFIDESRNRQEGNGNLTIQGVEFDKAGAVVAYHMFKQHPGGDHFARFRTDTERVDARYIIRVFERLRPGQVRGVPILAPVAVALNDLGEFMDAERIAKKMQACLAVFVTTDNDEDQPITGEGGTKDAEGKHVIGVHPGAVNRLRSGEEVQFMTPTAAGEVTGYLQFQLQEIATGLGIPYHGLTGDLRSANYSSLREGKLQFWSMIDMWQHHMMFPALRRVVAEFALYAHHLHGLPMLPRASFNTPTRPWVDPEKDIKAEVRLIRAGLKPWQQAVEERGGDVEETIRQFAEAGVWFDTYGMVFDIDARHVNQSGARHGSSAAPSQDKDQETDDDEDEDEDGE